jgi:GxxExxY protein
LRRNAAENLPQSTQGTRRGRTGIDQKRLTTEDTESTERDREGDMMRQRYPRDLRRGVPEEDDPVTAPIIGAAIEVHRALGPGLLESVYEKCLCHELAQRGIPFVRQAKVPIFYKNQDLECELFVDILIPELVVVELKSVDKTLPIHEAQLLTYMKLTGITRGLLINFNVQLLKGGITRRRL